MEIVEVGAIVVICLFIGMWLKKWNKIDNNFIPHILGGIGGIFGIVALYTMPDFPADNFISALASGILSGFGAVGFHQALKPMYKQADKSDDG